MADAQHHIFISHSHLDNDFGTRLAQDLRRVLKEESAIFYDVLGGLHGGDTWWEKIVEELTARDIFLLVLSPDAMNSLWVRREINIALNKNKLILPVLHRPCTIRADLEIIQIISFLTPKPYETAFREVLIALDLPLDIALEPKERIHQGRGPATKLLQQMEAAFAAHDWPDIIRKANYLIKHQPESISSTVYRWQGLALLEEGDMQEAQDALETALALVSDRELRLTLLGDYTGLLVRQEQWDRVLQRANEALRLAPHDPAWLATQQQAQNQLSQQAPRASSPRKQEQAKEKETAPVPSKTKEQWIEEGTSLYNLTRYEDALYASDQAIRLDPNYALAYNLKGRALYAFTRYEEALLAFEQAIRLDPNYALAYINKSSTLYSLTRYEEALSASEQAIRLDPKYARAYYDKGNALYRLMRYEEALSASNQAIRLDPKYAFAYNNKGNALDSLKRYEEAVSAYDQAIRLDPNFALAYRNKSNTLYRLMRYEDALSASEQAIRLDPNDALAYNTKGSTLHNLKRYEEALSAYEQAIRLDPNDALVYYNKGNTLERLGKKQEAQQAHEKARQLGYTG